MVSGVASLAPPQACSKVERPLAVSWAGPQGRYLGWAAGCYLGWAAGSAIAASSALSNRSEAG